MDLIEYVGSLPPIKISPLYDNPFTCLAVLRSLEPVPKQYIFRLIFLEDSVPQSLVTSWAKPSAIGKHQAAMDTLTRLQIICLSSKSTIEREFSLSPSFAKHVRAALCSGTAHGLHKVPKDVLQSAPSKQEADDLASKQWETLLLFAVGGGPCPEPSIHIHPYVPLDLSQLLASAQIINLNADGTSSVTQIGFQYLLSDTYGQLWQLLREYIARAERQSSGNLSSVLGFLLQLGFQGERPLCCSDLNQKELDIAAHMVQLGVLVAFRVGKEVWLQPTRLAVLIASGASTPGGVKSDGFVIVETNSRVYAYTSSPVRQAILRLFVRCDVLLPNLFVGSITRESVLAALENGVSAEQIIGYLRQHAHSRVANRIPIVPGVVADQIRLWQRELQRIAHRTAVHYTVNESIELYNRIVSYAIDLGVLLLRNNPKREMVVAAEAHEKIKAKIKAEKELLGL